ncbi:MAG: hypothetical protein K6F46_08015 [Desulfovibrio sp.]|nr:hypothetical protein [Desulfovibrio sp.]
MLLTRPALPDLSINDEAALRADKKNAFRFGRCSVGKKAVYMGGWYFDCCRYVPLSAVSRIFKRVAMSKGGFTGRGVFASIPYCVVECRDGRTVTTQYRHEGQVDALLDHVRRAFPRIPTMSAAADKKIEDETRAEEAQYRKNLGADARATIAELEKAADFLGKRNDLVTALAEASRRSWVGRLVNPAYKWVALAITLMAFAAGSWGAWEWWAGTREDGIYIALIGFAIVFLFSGARVLPTMRDNKKALAGKLEKVRADMADYLAGYEGFPVPARYAHPSTLARMIRSVRMGRAESAAEAYEDMKAVLRAINSSVTVSRKEYDEITAIKPMFLLEDYR